MLADKQRFVTRQEVTALISCLINLALTVAKFSLFYHFVKSISLKAEAWHSLSDVGSSFVVFLVLYWGRKRSQTPKEENLTPKSRGLFSAEEPEQPARPKRAENFVAIGIACFFILVCIGIIWEIFQPQPIETDYALLVATGMLVMSYVSYLLYRFEYRVGMESDSPGLIADGYHSKIDMWGSILVAVALVCRKLGLVAADQVIAGFVCLGILGHAVEVLAIAARHHLRRPTGLPVERHTPEQDDVSAAVAIYALTGTWGEQVSNALTHIFARLLCIKQSGPHLGRRVARRLIKVGVFAALCLYVLSGLFVCGPGEQAFVERFGRPTSTKPFGPGLHYRFPWPVDRTVKAEVGRIQTFCLGTLPADLEKPILWTNRHYTEEFRYLTGDENFVMVFLVVHFRISNLYDHLYRCDQPVAVLAHACESHMRDFAGKNGFFDCLTNKRRQIESDLFSHLAETVKPFGLEILTVALRDVHPPTEVAPSFEAVVSAMEERETAINVAKAYEIGSVPLAMGRAVEITAVAEAHQNRIIHEASASTGAFVALQQQYITAPGVTRVRMYLETIEGAIAQTHKWVLLDDELPSTFELWLPKGAAYWRWCPGIQGEPANER